MHLFEASDDEEQGCRLQQDYLLSPSTSRISLLNHGPVDTSRARKARLKWNEAFMNSQHKG